MKIGLITVGGSLFGIYQHTAVCIALRNLNLKPDVILGASAGAITGSFMASNMTTDMMRWKMSSLTAKEFLDPISKIQIFKELVFNHGRRFYGFIKGDQLEKYVHDALLIKDDFSKLEIPFYVAVTNLKSYKLVLLNTGTVSDKVRASCAIPMMFCPKKIDNQYYIDGAIYKDRLPRALLGIHPDLDYVIVSNASYDQETDDNSYIENAKIPMVEIVRRTMSMQERFSWPKKFGKTKLIYLTPGISTPVDIFKPNHEIANSVFQDTLKYSKYHLEKYFKRVHAHQQRREKKALEQQQQQNPPPPNV